MLIQLNYTMKIMTLGPAPKAERSKALWLAARFHSALSEVQIMLRTCEKVTSDLGLGGGFTCFYLKSSFLQHYQLSKMMNKKNPNSNLWYLTIDNPDITN